MRMFPEQQNTPKALGGRGFAPHSTGEAHSALTNPLAGGEGVRCAPPQEPPALGAACRGFRSILAKRPPHGFSTNHTTLFTFGKGSTIIRKKNESEHLTNQQHETLKNAT